MGAADVVQQSQQSRPALESYPQEKFLANLPVWRQHIERGAKTAEEIIEMVSSKAILSDEQKNEIRKPIHVDQDGVIDADFVREMEGAE